MLSYKAQEVLNVLEKVRINEHTDKYLERDDKGRLWLPVDNILNGWVEGIPEDFKKLLDNLHTVIHANLIGKNGNHSAIYYELKNNQYTLWVTEADSFGPLGSAVKCPNADWSVAYG